MFRGMSLYLSVSHSSTHNNLSPPQASTIQALFSPKISQTAFHQHSLKMDPSLFLTNPPPLSPAWLAHEKAAGLLDPKPVSTDPARDYSNRCKALNAALLVGRDKHLASGLTITDFLLPPYPGNTHCIPIRSYVSPSLPESGAGVEDGVGGVVDEKGKGKEKENGGGGTVVIYYHGGGLLVGDLDSEDMTCRHICFSFARTVYSVAYRLMPEYTADDALSDAATAFLQLTSNSNPKLQPRSLILVGSSSGGQLAAQVSQLHNNSGKGKISGVLLRAPVTSDFRSDPPPKWRGKHNSMSAAFHTSLLSTLDPAMSNRTTTTPLPLEGSDMGSLPRHWIQVCTNDMFYSDGVCYAAALMEEGVEVRLAVEKGWPHTYWLKAPVLEDAVRAEREMLDGMRWLLEG